MHRFASVLFCLSIGLRPAFADPIEPVVWPETWTVFAPLPQTSPVVDANALRRIPVQLTIPESADAPEIVLDARQVSVVPGAPVDLTGVMDGGPAGTTAYVFARLESPVAQIVTLGLGADWWMQCWMNGEPFFDTLERGNRESPIGILNHEATVTLREGENILAIRFSRGNASADLAVGDRSHHAAEQARQAAKRERRALNLLPETLVERLVLPRDEQAVATAGWSIDLSLPETDPATGALLGLQSMPERQVYLDAPEGRRAQLLDTLEPRFDEPVRIRLSKYRYPAEDRHLDAIVWTTPPEGERLLGQLDILLKDADGHTQVEHAIESLSPSGWFFSIGFPEAMVGTSGTLEIVWRDGDREIARGSAPFHVDEPSGVARTGRVPLRLLNEPGAVLRNAPMTVGVPFPRGALPDADRVRLYDEFGREQPLQARVSARWSRFGPVKWLLCDFTADLEGEPREWFLEYGSRESGVGRPEPVASAVDGSGWVSMDVDTTHTGFPEMDAGALRFGPDGIAFDAAGNGAFVPALSADALTGAFVRHANGKVYRPDPATPFVIEESGPAKIVIRRTGWYVAKSQWAVDIGQLAAGDSVAISDPRFCQYVTRYVIHHGSPLVRIFHTWIFTGDGNRDRIDEMGWRFEAFAPVTDGAFLLDADTGSWAETAHLVQHDYRHYLLSAGDEVFSGRTPGVSSARIGDVRVTLGAKDFWQNFPSELAVDDAGLTFYNWPRHNPPATFERPVPPSAAFLHRFAHEGKRLDFRLPEEYATAAGGIWAPATRRRDKHWLQDRPETANAQGIARTEELFLLFSPSGTQRDEASPVMRGLNDESLRAVVDPAWLAASGVFGDIHPRDRERYAEDEHLYEQVVKAPGRWNEHLGFYGMWLHGDVPAWGINFENRTATLYRAIRKNHHGWPIGWLPFARSGDPRMLKPAEAATRQMLDANFCHYASEDVDAAVAPFYRRQGWWKRSLLPWAAFQGPVTRDYTVDCDYIWQAYYLTGYTRARDVALLFGLLTQHDHGVARGPRWTTSMLPSYLDMYQATFDPWFLAASHAIIRLHLRLYPQDAPVDDLTEQITGGSFWRPANLAFQQYTRDEDTRLLARNYAVSWSSPRAYATGSAWMTLALPHIPMSVHAYHSSGNRLHLDRAAAYLDLARMQVYDGPEESARGSITRGGTAMGIFTGYYIKQFPLALGAFERAGHQPDPVPNPFWLSDHDGDRGRQPRLEILMRKTDRPFSLQIDARQDNNAYTLYGPDGEVFQSGSVASGERLDMPADAPQGIYRLQGGSRYLLAPVADPDIPEVIAFQRDDNGTTVAGGLHELQYWFKVPEATRSFWVQLPAQRSQLDRRSIWNPDGVRVWDSHHDWTLEAEAERVEIEVTPNTAGRLWRITGSAFRIDPEIPPYFSVSRRKWFDPER